MQTEACRKSVLQFVVIAQVTGSQSPNVTLTTNICRLSLGNRLLESDMKGNVVLDTELKKVDSHVIG